VKASDLGLQPIAGEARPLEDMSMEEVEAFLVNKALRRFEGNVSKAAGALGLSRSAFYRRMEKYQTFWPPCAKAITRFAPGEPAMRTRWPKS
jgi:transcriptional regulator of acetoin/glycerol metabolism